MNFRDFDWKCPKCESDDISILYAKEKDVIVIRCNECKYFYDAEPADKITNADPCPPPNQN